MVYYIYIYISWRFKSLFRTIAAGDSVGNGSAVCRMYMSSIYDSLIFLVCRVNCIVVVRGWLNWVSLIAASVG